jgi:hypothetical protein
MKPAHSHFVKSAGLRTVLKPKITEKTIASLHRRLFGTNIKEAGAQFDALKTLITKIPNKNWVNSFLYSVDDAADLAKNPIRDFAKLPPLHAQGIYEALSGKRVVPATLRQPSYAVYGEPATPWNHPELQEVLGANLFKNPFETTIPKTNQAPAWIQRLPQKNKDAYVESVRTALRKNPEGRMPAAIKYAPKENASGFNFLNNDIVLGNPFLTGGRRYRPYSPVFHESGHAVQEKAITDLGITANSYLDDTAKKQIGHLFYSEGSPMFKLFEEQRANNLGYQLLEDYLTKAKVKHKKLYLGNYLNDMSRVNQKLYADEVSRLTPTHAVRDVIEMNTPPRILPLLGHADYNAGKNIGFLGHPNAASPEIAEQWLETLAERILANKNLIQMLQRGKYNPYVPSR